MGKPRVLYVEDDKTFHELAGIYLEPHATLVIAPSISSAMRLLNEDPSFAFIILDGRVPQLDNEVPCNGETTIELAAFIQQNYRIPTYSASGDDDINKRLAALGCIETDKGTAIQAVRQALVKMASAV